MSQKLVHDHIVVAIPIYNEARFIVETIRSVKAQDWQDFLVLISDNCSNDGTEAICRREIADDPRFHYIRHSKNMGAAENFNFALDATDSPYFMWLGGHDIIAPEFLRLHLRALEMQSESSLSYSLTQWIDETGSPIKVTDPSRLGDVEGSPLARYFGSIRRLRECTAINNVLRRSAIGPTRLNEAVGCDKVMLSEMLFNGPAHRIDRPLYCRRAVSKPEAYMERLTGQRDQSFDEATMIPLYLESHAKLPIGRPTKWLTRRLLTSLLARRVNDRRTRMDRLHFRIMEWMKL
jgi:O-antigen biosynthesis protein